MPFLQTCSEPDCPNLVARGRCREHAILADREIKDRSSWRWVYADRRWKSLRKSVRREQLVCAYEGCFEIWTVLDHIVALQDDGAPFDRTNVQGLCKRHHDSKTADEVNARRSS